MDELIARLRGATRGLCSEDASGYIPRGVSAADCAEAADTIIRLREALEQIVSLDTPINIVDVLSSREREMIEIARAGLTTKTDTIERGGL